MNLRRQPLRLQFSRTFLAIVASMSLCSLCTKVIAQAEAQLPKGGLHFNVIAKDPKTDKDKIIGSATFNRSSRDEQIRKILSLNLKVYDKVTTIIIDTTAKPDGTPLSKSFLQNGDAGGRILAAFTATGAEVIKPSAGTQTTGKMNFPAPAGMSILDPTEAWFSINQPTVGQKVTYASFNVQSLTWDEITAVYIEDADKSIGKKTYKTHHVRFSSASGSLDEYFDAHGDPVLIDYGSYRIERADS